jgi:hypothetical protein
MSSPPRPPTPGARRGPLVGALALALMLPAAARAAVVLDAFHQGSASNSPDLTNTPFTVGPGANRLMIIAVSIAGDVPVTSAGFKGVAAQRFLTESNNQPSAPCHTEVWRIINPPTGPGTVAVTLSGAAAFGVGVVSYFGVDQKNPMGTAGTSAGTDSSIRVSANVPDGRPLVGVACLGGSWPMLAGPNAVTGSGDTNLWDFTEPNLVGLGGHQASAGSVTVSWNVAFSGTFVWAAAGVTIAPAALAPPPDAGPDASPDLRPDARLPGDPPAGTDLAPDLPPPPDAGIDAQDPADPDAEIEPDADIQIEDAEMEPPLEEDGPPPLAEDGGQTTVRDVNLRVGCACRQGASGRPGVALIVVLGWLLARRRPR